MELLLTQISIDERLEMPAQLTLVHGDRVRRVKSGQLEGPAKDTRHLHRELLRHRQLIDAAVHDDLHAARQLHGLAACRGRELADAILDLNQIRDHVVHTRALRRRTDVLRPD